MSLDNIPARLSLSIIVAMSPNHAIGCESRLPWHLPEDLARFKRLTTGHAIIMGRRTFDSLPNGALPGRRNVVLSRTAKTINGCEVFETLEAALETCAPNEETFIIGGESLYRQALPLANKLYITLVASNPAHADTFFPCFNKNEWVETRKEKRNGFSFITLLRRQGSCKS